MRTLPTKSMLAVAAALLLVLFAPAAKAGDVVDQLQRGINEIQRQRQGPTQGDLDLNYASQSQLETIPNVDRETARRIMDNRPYRSMQDLSRAGLSQRMIDGLYNVAHVSTRDYATSGSDRRYAANQYRGRLSAQVWVDPYHKVYYRQGSRWFGHTRGGRHMSERQALKHGYHLAPNWKTGNKGNWDSNHRNERNKGNWDSNHRKEGSKGNEGASSHNEGNKGNGDSNHQKGTKAKDGNSNHREEGSKGSDGDSDHQ